MLDHLDDIESDLSAIHRIDDYEQMEPVRFFRFALRLPAYKGVMRARVEAEEAKRAKRKSGHARQTTTSDPAISGYFEHERVS